MSENVIRPMKLYANEVFIQSTPYDFDIGFHCRFGSGENLSTIEDCEVQILISPQHAKAFVKLLQEKVEEYELFYGEIFPGVSGP